MALARRGVEAGKTRHQPLPKVGQGSSNGRLAGILIPLPKASGILDDFAPWPANWQTSAPPSGPLFWREPTACSPEDRLASKAGMAAAIPRGRFGKPCELASAALFLVSPAASFVTGIHLRIDGGMALL